MHLAEAHVVTQDPPGSQAIQPTQPFQLVGIELAADCTPKMELAMFAQDVVTAARKWFCRGAAGCLCLWRTGLENNWGAAARVGSACCMGTVGQIWPGLHQVHFGTITVCVCRAAVWARSLGIRVV